MVVHAPRAGTDAEAGTGSPTRVVYRTCPLCEATCGLELTLRDGAVERIRGDTEDVFSAGYICAKGTSLTQLHEDPDRLRRPLVKRDDGSFGEVTWQEAFAEVERRLCPIVARHGTRAVAAYVGNPMGHSLSGPLYLRAFYRALGRPTLFTVGTVDQHAKSLACALMFGSQFTVPVPDLDRTSYLLLLGANPAVSNGSLIAAPNVRKRLRAIRLRGGKVVVIDPRRTQTAREADEHHFIRPGTDALLLAAFVHTLFEEDLVELGRLLELVTGVEAVRAFAEPFSPERVEPVCGVPALEIRRLARELSAAESAAVYGRIGTTTQAFGTAASWLVDVLNVLTGNLDRPGGAMFPAPAAGGPTYMGQPGRGPGITVGRWESRVRGLPEVLGELPLACLAEEIDTPGEGRLRALITFSGNPVLSNPNGRRLEGALRRLECLVCVDPYLNETTRHAHVILPPPSPLERSHYDVMIYPTAIRNVANYSPPALPLPTGALDEWEIVLRLAAIVAGRGHDADLTELDRTVARETLSRRTRDPYSTVAGRDPDELLAALEPRVGPERLLDINLRCGPYGDAFGGRRGGLTLAVLEAAPHGIDFGALEPRLPGVLRTPSGKVELAHPLLLADRERLLAELSDGREDCMVLIGRRDVRSMNSWLHNVPGLARGRDRCTMLIHPDDATRLGVIDGAAVEVRSRVGAIRVPAEVSDEIMRGVVSVPHGWGHGLAEARLSVAAEHPGANVNLLADEELVEPLSGASILNGIPVELRPVG
jgi:anaerobic selenocysteine-containing dehydrogenase